MSSELEIKNITHIAYDYREHIDQFLKTLGSEKAHFNPSTERVLDSEVVLIAVLDNRIIGLGGIELKYNIPRSIIILDKTSQGKGLGKKLMTEILKEGRNNHNIMVGVIEEGNNAALRLDLSVGYKMCWTRNNLHYLFYLYNIKGLIIFYMIKALFPLIKVIDYVRR